MSVQTFALSGVDAVPVAVEIDLLRRLPAVVIVGLPMVSARETADRVRSAIQQAGIEFPRQRVVVNLSPADLMKTGTGFDLPIAVGILAASGQVKQDRLSGTAFAAELSLDGRLRPVRGILAMAQAAKAQGIERLIVAPENAAEAALVSGIEVLPAWSLPEVVAWLRSEFDLTSIAGPLITGPITGPTTGQLDMADIRGQHRARRALEIAAAGGLSLLMIGPSGCGKTMLAARLPSILPDLSFDEAVDITRVHSAAGLSSGGLVTRRPFRAPHYTVSPAGLIGNAQGMPGEVSLAHRGVLFLDELPEFRRDVREVTTACLRTGHVSIYRSIGPAVRLPARAHLVGAANPCPCGYRGHPVRPCACSPEAIERYRDRLFGQPLAFDMQVHLQPTPADDRSQGETSAAIRQRVMAARQMAIGQGSDVAPESEVVPAKRRIARAIANLEGSEQVQARHVVEAAGFEYGLL